MWGECGEGEEVRLQVKRSRRGVNVKEGVIPGRLDQQDTPLGVKCSG